LDTTAAATTGRGGGYRIGGGFGLVLVVLLIVWLVRGGI
jgi:hypothetical protein